jgi:hypothetical protein
MTLLLDPTRERFLRAVVTKVDLEHIAEVHLFPPIRQGGVESGVAVIAVDPDGDAPVVVVEGARHVIYTARYRLVLKGPDRGKWESSVVAEADAPIITLEAVVRGVQRRAGDVDEPTRLAGEELREALDRVKK